MNESIALTSLFTITAVLNLVLAFYILLANSKSLANRAVASLLVLFGMTSIALTGLTSSFTYQAALPWLALQVATTYVVGPAIFFASLIILRPNIARRRWVYWSFLGLVIFLPLATLLDATGIFGLISKTPLIFTPPDPAYYSGGHISSGEVATGFLRPLFYFSLLGFSVISLIYPSLIVAIRDRKRDPERSRVAWVLFIAILNSTILSGMREAISPSVIILIQNLGFTIGFAYVGLQRKDEELNIRQLALAITDWSMFNKLLLIVITILLPAILIIGTTTITFLQSNIINLVGENLSNLATTEARSVSSEFNRQTASLLNIAEDPQTQTMVGFRESVYFSMDATEIRNTITSLDQEWQTAEDNDNIVQSLLSEVRSANLNNLHDLFPVHTLIIITDHAGGIVAATDRPENYDQSQYAWWQAAYNNGVGTTYVGDPVFDEATGEYIVEVALPIYTDDDNADVDGILFSRYSLTPITREFDQSLIGSSGGLALFDTHGNWVPPKGATPDQDPQLSSELIVSSNQSWKVTSFGNVDSVISWAHTKELGPDTENIFDLHIVSYISTDEALGTVTIARTSAIVLMLLVAFFAIIVTIYLARFITQPLSELTVAAQRILGGETNVQANVFGKDEIGTLASTFNTMTSQLSQLVSGLEETVSERTQALERRAVQMEASAQVAREAASIRDVNQLLTRVSGLISETFGYYHTGIFLLDEKDEYAVLQAASSEGGQRMLARGHKLLVGKVGVVGYAAGMNEPRIAQDVGADVIYYDNPDMPDTRSELALPLTIRDEVIGVLDVQSRTANAFSADDVQVLQTLADQLALAIENARLLQRSQTSLRELERLYGQQVEQAWRKRLENQPVVYQYNPAGVGLGSSAADSTGMSDGLKLTKEILFRGQKIGSIDLMRSSQQEEWTSDELALVEEIIDQTAQALENARLVEQIQLRSDQIQLLQEVTALSASLIDQQDLLEAVTTKLQTGMDLMHCGVILFDEHKTEGILVADASASSDTPGANLIGTKIELHNNEVTQEVIRTKKTLVLYDVQNNPRTAPIHDLMKMRDTNSLIIVPLIVRDDVVGTIGLDIADIDRRFDTEDVSLLDQISAQLAAALNITRLFSAEQQARQAAARRAEREHLVATITSKVRASN
ncbi:MAG: GAF domain-containing protein, partial [Anaerolineae bacterium]|nr:GAF domain-containing protein [Anaerolineae bacterium]